MVPLGQGGLTVLWFLLICLLAQQNLSAEYLEQHEYKYIHLIQTDIYKAVKYLHSINDQFIIYKHINKYILINTHLFYWWLCWLNHSDDQKRKRKSFLSRFLHQLLYHQQSQTQMHTRCKRKMSLFCNIKKNNFGLLNFKQQKQFLRKQQLITCVYAYCNAIISICISFNIWI